MGGNNFFLNLQ